jgi:hypothetical protein
VIYAEMATGPYDVIARGRVPNLHDLDLLPELLKRLDGVLRAPTGDARGPSREGPRRGAQREDDEMNRTQAIARVDEILDMFAEIYVSGRCPRCEVLLHNEEDRELPPGTAATRRIVHSASCEIARCPEELARLSRRFGIPLEPVLLAVPESDTWVVGVRRGNERTAEGGPAAGDMSEHDSVDIP